MQSLPTANHAVADLPLQRDRQRLTTQPSQPRRPSSGSELVRKMSEIRPVRSSYVLRFGANIIIGPPGDPPGRIDNSEIGWSESGVAWTMVFNERYPVLSVGTLGGV